MDLQDEQFLERELQADPRQALMRFSNTIIRQQLQKRADPVVSPLPALPTVTEARFDPLVMDRNPTGDNAGGGGGGDSGTAVRLSFQALAKLDTGTWKWGIWPGILYDTFDNGNAQLSITGLLATDLSSGFVTIGTYPQEIGLEIVTDWSTDPPTVSGVSVIHTSALDRRVEYVSDGATPPTYSQTYARIVLATATDRGDGGPLLTYKTGDLTLWFTSAAGVLSGGGSPQVVPCLYPF